MKTKSKPKPRKGLGNVAVRGSKAIAARQPRRVKAAQLLPRKANGAEILLTSLAIGMTGVLGYFGWQYYKKKKGEKSVVKADDVIKDFTPPVKETVIDTPPKAKAKSAASDDFPLKKGSKGEMVRRLQQALINKYGKSALPKYGADSDFGSETFNALKKNGLPTTVDESAFNVVTGGSGEHSSEITGLAEKLYNAASAKSITTVVGLLKKITDKSQYEQVNGSFLQYRLHGGARKTLVTGLLETFPDEGHKQQVRMEFLRMGLHYDGSKWSLSGFGGKSIVTTEPATVWVNSTKSIKIPANMVLGTEITQKMDFTLFENNRKYFLIKTSSVKYLN